MSESINTVVIGAGVIGLAVAREFALAGREVVVVDRHSAVGTETSSRNSEVVHAGIYYAPGSLKARLCVAGKAALYRYCESRSIPHKRIGKVIVATEDADRDALQSLRQRAQENGVDDLQWLDADALRQLEPAVAGVAALLSPSTGIVDSHALMQALHGDLESAGGFVALNSRIAAMEHTKDHATLVVDSAGETTRLSAQLIVNCAGLGSSDVARILHGEHHPIPDTNFARGHYFEYAGKSPFTHLVYPLPQPGGLGIHATVDLAGALRFGPDVEWVDRLDYSIDPERAASFAEAIRTYWPDLDAARLKPAYVGIRPKLSGPGEPAADFRFDRTQRGAQTIVDLFGIESPGLTSALAIAEHVRRLADQR